MAHKDWCGKPCSDCERPCKLDESIPCSPDCENLFDDGEQNLEKCRAEKCDAIDLDDRGSDMKTMYRYSINIGECGGVVLAENENTARQKLRATYPENSDEDILIWPWEMDEYYREESPEVIECYGL